MPKRNPVIPAFEIPQALERFRDKDDPRLYTLGGLEFLAYDLVYDTYGYSSYEEPLEPCYWYGAAADLARQLAPVVAWPSQCDKFLTKTRGNRSMPMVCSLTIFSSGNPWLAPWSTTCMGTTGDITRYADGWAAEWVYKISRQINGVIEALAFYSRTGRAVLPRTAADTARIKYVRSDPVYEFYPRIQDLEPQFRGWVRW